MIYVPSDSTFKLCPHVNSSSSIRVYDRQPQIGSYANYRDYYFYSSYLYNQGQQTWGNYSTLPNCIQDSQITHNVFYRNDIDKILIIFLIILIICFYFPYKIIARALGRWFKL